MRTPAKVFTLASIAFVAFSQISSISAEVVQVYFGNLHSHTSYSDGSGTPKEAYAYAKTVAKLDFLAITEHNHKDAKSKFYDDPRLYNGSGSDSLISAAKRATKDGQFIAFYGQEFSSISSGNHANILEVSNVIEVTKVPNGQWDKLFDEWLPANLDSQGLPAIVLLNHPAQSSSPNDLEYGLDDYGTLSKWLAAVERQVRLINMVNGPSHSATQSPGRPSENEFRRYLNLGLRVAPTADQDNHLRNWGNAANTRTGVIAEKLTKAHLLDAMRKRRVYATQDRNLRVVARINGELVGTRFNSGSVPANGSSLDIQVQIKDDDEPQAHYKIEVFSDEIGGANESTVVGRVTVKGDGQHAVANVRYPGGERYYYIRITQTDEDEEVKDIAWLAPVWFEPNGSVALAPAATSSSTDNESGTLTLDVDLEDETATISNNTTEPINLSGWVLLSVRGNQSYTILSDSLLEGGRSYVVSSGPLASAGRGRVVWTRAPIWANDGDEGRLIDTSGKIRARTPNEN